MFYRDFLRLGVAFRDAVIITLIAGGIGMLVNLVHPEKIPFVAEREYEILVPCSEPGGEVSSLEASHPDLQAGQVFIVDARSEEEHQIWNFRQAMNVPFDYLESIPEDVIKELATRIARSKVHRVVVYGDGQQPDSGEQLGKEISGRGIKNVFFVKGGAPALRNAQGGGQ